LLLVLEVVITGTSDLTIRLVEALASIGLLILAVYWIWILTHVIFERHFVRLLLSVLDMRRLVKLILPVKWTGTNHGRWWHKICVELLMVLLSLLCWWVPALWLILAISPTVHLLKRGWW